MSEPIENTFAEIAPIYGNIIDEARTRLEYIERALDPKTEALIGYVAVSDLCALQFRKTFEAIALGCLLVHGDLPGTKRLKDHHYRADKLLRALTRLNPDFYPHPCTTKKGRDGNTIFQDAEGAWLTKSQLFAHYFEFDHHMHVGTLSRRRLNATALARPSLQQVLERARVLVSGHYISLVDRSRRIACFAPIGDGDPVKVVSLTEV